jgi:hypothetical protein
MSREGLCQVPSWTTLRILFYTEIKNQIRVRSYKALNGLPWGGLGAGIGLQACLRRVCAKYQVALPPESFAILQLKLKSDWEIMWPLKASLEVIPLGVGIGSQACLRRVHAKYQLAPPSGTFFVLQLKIKSDWVFIRL